MSSTTHAGVSDDAFAALRSIVLHRGCRIGALVALIVVLGLADLYMTLTHMNGAGMAEGNPIARYVMQFDSPLVLIGFKLISLAIFGGILMFAREHRIAELVGWVGLIVMVWLTARWSVYNRSIAALPAAEAIQLVEEANWVRFGGARTFE